MNIPTEAKLLLRSGFGPGVTVSRDELCGADSTLPFPNSWNPAEIGDGKLFTYVGNQVQHPGFVSENPRAEYGITKADDPAGSGRQVMRYAYNALEPGKGFARTQANMHCTGNLHEFYYKYDLYITPDLAQFANYEGEVNWMMLLEFWNEENWLGESRQYPYRVSVYLNKKPGLNQPFRIKTSGQIAEGWYNKETDDWVYDPAADTDGTPSPGEGYVRWGGTNEWAELSQPTVPLGEWLKCEVYYKTGGRNEGEFYFAATRPCGEKLVFCDKTGPGKCVATKHPHNKTGKHICVIQPFKLYTGADFVRFIDDVNVANCKAGNPTNYKIEVFFDNVEFWSTKPLHRG